MSVLNQEISIKSIASSLGAIGKRRGRPGGPEKLKTTINFVGINETHENWGLAIPGVIVIVVAAVLLSKFAVADRYERLWERQSRARALETQLADGMAQISGSSELTDQFYHYSWTLLNDEERTRVSRVEIAELIRFIASQINEVNSYTMAGETLTVNITAPTLESISRLATALEERSIVENCSVQTAQTDLRREAAGGVTAQMVIYIQPPQDDAENGAAQDAPAEASE